MFDVITVGEPMVLFASNEKEKIRDAEQFTKYTAGSELNVSVGLSRLNYDVVYVTRLGKDPFGEFMYDFIKSEKINTSHIKFDPSRPTGLMFKGKSKDKDPEIFYMRRNSAASGICKDDLDFGKNKSAKVIHLTGISLALSEGTKKAVFFLAQFAKENGIKLTVDPNLRYQLWDSKDEMINTVNTLAFMSDVFLPGLKESQMLTGFSEIDQIASFYLNKGVKTVIIKLGKNGAAVFTDKEFYTVPGFKVPVVDTVGAGDGFAVGFISGLLDELTLKDSVIRGNAIGALQVMTPGDNDGLPNRTKLEEFLRSMI